jgi:hypothetical protein
MCSAVGSSMSPDASIGCRGEGGVDVVGWDGRGGGWGGWGGRRGRRVRRPAGEAAGGRRAGHWAVGRSRRIPRPPRARVYVLPKDPPAPRRRRCSRSPPSTACRCRWRARPAGGRRSLAARGRSRWLRDAEGARPRPREGDAGLVPWSRCFRCPELRPLRQAPRRVGVGMSLPATADATRGRAPEAARVEVGRAPGPRCSAGRAVPRAAPRGCHRPPRCAFARGEGRNYGRGGTPSTRRCSPSRKAISPPGPLALGAAGRAGVAVSWRCAARPRGLQAGR